MNEQQAWQQRVAQLNKEIPELLTSQQPGKTVLYVGATPWRFQMGRELHEAGYDITLLEAYRPYANHYREHPWLSEVICDDIRNITRLGKTWDLVVWWHGPEHIGESELPSALSDIESVTKDFVILGSPWGKNLQGATGGNSFCEHKSHYDTGTFTNLGYETRTLGSKSDPSTWCHILAWKRLDSDVTDSDGEGIDGEGIVYTANFGNYDNLLLPEHCGFTHIHLTDEGAIGSKYQELPQVRARMCKVLSHKLFPDYKYTIWHDASIEFKLDPAALVCYLGDNDIALMAHPERDCIYDEATAVVEMGKERASIVSEQMEHYKAEGYPEHNGLVATGVIVRKHTAKMEQFNNAWWAEIGRYSVRDQLSFNYVCWKMGIKYDVIPGNLWDNKWFVWHGHS